MRESGVFVEFDYRGDCVRPSIPPYADINPEKCEAVTPIVFDGSEYGWEETRLYSWNLKVLPWSCQVFSQSQFITTPIQHFWLLRLRFIVLIVWLKGSDPFWRVERFLFPSVGYFNQCSAHNKEYSTAKSFIASENECFELLYTDNIHFLPLQYFKLSSSLPLFRISEMVQAE